MAVTQARAKSDFMAYCVYLLVGRFASGERAPEERQEVRRLYILVWERYLYNDETLGLIPLRDRS
jgi:hypothetical protein